MDFLLDNFSLSDIFEQSNMATDVDNNEPPLLQNSPYFNAMDFGSFLEGKSSVFNLISLNCQSLKAKFDSLKYYIENYNNDSHKIKAICLQETWLAADSDLSMLHIPGYRLISKGRSCSAHGGVAIFLHESVKFKIIDLGYESDVCDSHFIEIHVNTSASETKVLVLGNIYRPPRQSVSNTNSFINELESIFDKFRNVKHVVLAGDFNYDLLKFKVDNLVNNFLECIMSSGYIPKIMLPTRLTQRQGTLIDNFFVKISDEYSCCSAGILLNEISDHLPYFLCLDYLQCCQTKTNFVQTMPSFSNNIGHLLDDLQQVEAFRRPVQFADCKDANSSYNCFIGILTNLVDKHFPCKYVRYNKYKHRKMPWMTNGIIKSIQYRDKMYVKLKTTPANSDQLHNLQINFRTYKNILRKTIRASKRTYYYNIFNKYKSDVKNTWATINDIICKTKNKCDFPDYFLVNGVELRDKKIIASEFNSYFTTIGPKLAEKIQAPVNKTFNAYLGGEICHSFQFKEVNVQDIINAINTIESKASSGYDRISNRMLKAIKNIICLPLTLIINQTLQTGVFPDALKIAKVLPVYKKNEKFLMENYRPISILSSVSKVFERIIYNQIYEYFTQFNLFYGSQYGFRSKHSTEFASLELVERIIEEMDQNKYPISVFMDLSKAFDTLDHQILIDKLNHYGFRGKALELLKSYLSGRKQFVEYNNTASDFKSITCGVPQGSILGPLLFIIYINDLPAAVKQFETIIYADDTTLFSSLYKTNANSTDTLLLNEELSMISDWLKVNKLSLNVAKTKAIMFHTPQRRVSYPDLYIDDVKIDYVNEFNYLGLILDKHLNWKSHTNMISKKVSKTIGIMSKFKKIIPKFSMYNIYNALVLSYLNYGLIVWGHKSEKLFKLQKKAIRIVNCEKYNAHTSPLFRNDNILKLRDMCALHDLKFCFKYVHGLLPEYFLNKISMDVVSHAYATRQTGQLKVPAVRHEFARNAIKYRFPVMFNNMPPNIKDKIYTHSFQGFKLYIKKYFTQSYSTDCQLQNCYICQNSEN